MQNLKLLCCAVSLAAVFAFSGSSRAMTLDNFARLNVDDEATYVTMMVESSAKLLRQQGKPDEATKTLALFHDASKNGGVSQLAMNLKAAHNRNIMNQINPNNRAAEIMVEDAMARTLKDNGIIVPVSFLLGVQKDFHPTGVRRPLILSQ
jgi:hypothetical protein